MVGHRIGVCGRRLNPPSSMANAYVSMASSRPPQRNELEAGNGELTEPGQRVIAVALIDVHHLVDLADDEDVGNLDAAYKDRHSSPRVVGATIDIAA